MNFFDRAIKNTIRKMSKTVLLVLTFFLIGNLVIIGLGVANASENAKILTRKKMRAVVSLQIDHNAIWEYVDTLEEEEQNEFYKHYPNITYQEVKDMLQDERVKTANALTSNQFYTSETFDYVHLNNQAEQNMGGGQSCWIDDSGAETCHEYVEPSFFIKGNFFPQMIEFADGEYTITEGRFYNEEEIINSRNVAIISENLAAHNGLRVGDTFEINAFSPSEVAYGNSGLTKEDCLLNLEVIGIFTHTHPVTPDANNYDYCYPYENPDNMIFMPSTTIYRSMLVYQQKNFDYYAGLYPDDEYYANPENRPSAETIDKMPINDATLLLNDPMDVDQFVEDYSDSTAQFKKISANNEEFNRLSRPLDTLNLYANFIIWLVVINAIVIITLVTALTLKTREYEIGVLLSIGATKLKIIAQFFIELAIVAILGFTLAIGSGSLVANKVGNSVLEYQLASSDVTNNDKYGNFIYNNGYNVWDENYTTDVTIEDLVAEYNVSVSPVIIAEIYILGLGIVAISILIPSLMIMRYNPKRILMSQN